MRRRKVMELKNIKVQKAFEEFLEEHKAKNTSDNTLDTYKLHIDSFMDITDCQWLTTAMLDKSFYTYFITELQEEGRKKDTTIASYCRSVRAFLYWLMDNGYMKEEPLKIPKFDKTVKETYTQEEITTLLQQERFPDMQNRQGYRLGQNLSRHRKWQDDRMRKENRYKRRRI